MSDYYVTWSIDTFDVSSPREAARQAREAQLRPGTWAVIFNVTDKNGITTTVDLLDDEETGES
jgi:hypothetical protein